MCGFSSLEQTSFSPYFIGRWSVETALFIQIEISVLLPRHKVPHQGYIFLSAVHYCWVNRGICKGHCERIFKFQWLLLIFVATHGFHNCASETIMLIKSLHRDLTLGFPFPLKSASYVPQFFRNKPYTLDEFPIFHSFKGMHLYFNLDLEKRLYIP